MKKILNILILLILIMSNNNAQELKPIQLSNPNLKRGLPVMEAFSRRASSTSFSSRKLSQQDLSDLLFAANGINRKYNNKRTAPSAQNAQDIDLYVFFEEGVYFYNAQKLKLDPLVSGDHRGLFSGNDPSSPIAKAPVIILLVTDLLKFNINEETKKIRFATYDAGIVSQNINLFCAGMGLITRPRIDMDIERIRTLLKLKDTQIPMLNNAVGYPSKVGLVSSEIKYRMRNIIK